MARKPNPAAAPAEHAPLPAAEITGNQQLMARIETEFGAEARAATLLVGGRIARRKMIEGLTKLLTVSDVQDLANIKESKQYKGFTHIDADGKPRPVRSWAEYCDLVEGRSQQSIDEEIRNLETLGPEAFAAMRTGGIGPRTMRTLRALPGTELAEITEAAQAADKDALLDMVGDLIAKQAAEKAKLTKERDDARQKVADASTRIRTLTDEREAAIAETDKAHHRWRSTKPDAQIEALRVAVRSSMKLILSELAPNSDGRGLRHAIHELADAGAKQNVDVNTFLGHAIAELLTAVRQVRDDETLPALIPIVSDGE